MTNSFFKPIAILGLTLSIAAALGSLFLKPWIFALGVMVGALWMLSNLFFLGQLLEMGFSPVAERAPKNTKKILLFSILKFPVLYVGGFFILRAHFFPISSLLIGLSAFSLALCLGWARGGLMAKSFKKVSV